MGVVTHGWAKRSMLYNEVKGVDNDGTLEQVRKGVMRITRWRGCIYGG
jgi:hypothetical protein